MNNHLPDDIVLNILARLPVKSVLRMRCICQSWCSSITTPNFISTHTLVNNNKDHCYIIHNLWTTRDSRVAFDCHTFDRISEFGIPHDFPSECVIVGSCNGILCVAGCGSVSTDDVIYLWNPSIRKFKQLPNTCLGKLSDVKLGFAYHSENNDYKVVRISCSPFSTLWPLPEIEVYTLSSDSWRRLGISLRNNVMFYCDLFLFSLPLVNGAWHWMVNILEEKEKHKRREEVIVSFDVNSETFRELAMPDDYINADCCLTSLTLFKGKLAFITFGRSEQSGFRNSFYIWVMMEYGVLESWNKVFVGPLERLSFYVAITEYGSLLLRRAIDLVKEDFELVLVDIETLHEKDPDIQDPHSCVAAFMGSLALLDGANMVSY
jgi:F-box interacting protein